MFRKRIARLIIIGLALLVAAPAFGGPSPYGSGLLAQERSTESERTIADDALYEGLDRVIGRLHYSDYYAAHVDSARPEREIVIEAEAYSKAEGMSVEKREHFAGMDGISVWTDEQGWIEWEFDVPEAGLYHISMLYYSVEGKSSEIQRSLLINGQLPFAEADHLQFYRVWTNLHDEIRMDNQGHELPGADRTAAMAGAIIPRFGRFLRTSVLFLFPRGKKHDHARVPTGTGRHSPIAPASVGTAAYLCGDAPSV